MSEFSKSVVWITGGGSGIGRAMAHAFAQEGAKVVISGRRRERLEMVKKEIQELGAEALAIPCDVTSEDDVHRCVNEIIDRYSKLDVAVANAGIGIGGTFETLSSSDWHRQMNVNLFGVIHVLQATFSHLKKTRGRAVVLSSISGKIGQPRVSAYCTSKFALVGLCASLYSEWAKYGVSVIALLPGIVASEIRQVDKNGVYHPDRPDNRSPLLMWQADKAARVMLKAIARRKREAVITGHGKLATFIFRYFPGIAYWILARLEKH